MISEYTNDDSIYCKNKQDRGNSVLQLKYKGKENLFENSIAQQTLSLSITTESDCYDYSKAHNIWSMVTLSAVDNGYGFAYQKRLPVDFVVVIDISGSMKQNNKLASVLATLQYMIELLNENDRFSLVQFNDSAKALCPLLRMNENNKIKVIDILHQIEPSGNTNLSDGLFTGLNILAERTEEQPPISRLFLLTDGLANRGLTQASIVDHLSQIQLPSTLTIHSFGYGMDHDPSCLQKIAFCSSGGLYYFIEDENSIAATFGECIAGAFSTVAYNINVELEAFDGCRFIQLKTKCDSNTRVSMKYYTISMGSMYEQEKRTIVIKQSLRALEKSRDHKLFRVTVTYNSFIDGQEQIIQQLFAVQRNTPNQSLENISIDLVRQLNRIEAAEAIDAAIQAANTKNYGIAIEHLNSSIRKISDRNIFKDFFSNDLIEDLKECVHYLSDPFLYYSFGIHQIHSYSTMYNQERSPGCKVLEKRANRSSYGYCTPQQLLEVQYASEKFISCISNYHNSAIAVI